MDKINIGRVCNKENVTKYILCNDTMEVEVMDLGATIMSIKVKDKNGDFKDVVLGYDTPDEYLKHTYFFGATIGRNANRIANATCLVDGKSLQLDANNFENNLHSGNNGYDINLFKLEEFTKNSLTLSISQEDGAQGYPGNITTKVTFSISDDCELKIHYSSIADTETVINCTNHSYFNLDGHDSGLILNQELQLNSSFYVPVIDYKSIPTGEIAKVDDTPMDFRKMKKIGQDINADFVQLKHTKGYDHNFCIDKKDDGMNFVAKAKGAESGIIMEVYSDCEGVQLYTGNFIEPHKGKNGAAYDFRHGFCLETQYYPDAVNQKNFKSPLVPANTLTESDTIFKFKV